jgi:hypothetical protein
METATDSLDYLAKALARYLPTALKVREYREQNRIDLDELSEMLGVDHEAP